MRCLRLVAVVILLGACARVGGPSGRPLTGPSPSPSPLGEGIRFVLADSYEVGERVDVAIENLGPATYRYNEAYAACDLTYRDASGREFIVPSGTHCDLIFMVEIRPGETQTLFQWDLDECVRDEWGCVKSEPLPPGEYSIEGSFEHAGEGGPRRPPPGTGERDRATVTFAIEEPGAA